MITKTAAAREQILERIKLRVWNAGERLPGLRDLAAQLGFTAYTTERALQILLKQGILDRHPKHGTYVSSAMASQRMPPPIGVIGAWLQSLMNPRDLYIAPLLAGMLAQQPHPNWLFLEDYSPDDFVRAMRLLDGRCVVAISQSAEQSAQLTSYAIAGMHVLCLGSRVKSPLVHYIAVDNDYGMTLGMRYLAKLGHQRVAFIAQYMNLTDHRERARAFRTYRTRFGFDRKPEYVIALPCDEDIRKSSDAAQRAFARDAVARWFALPQPPTAIFCSGCDLLPYLADALVEADIHVPHDVSLIVFDELQTDVIPGLPLTVIRQPLEEMGHKAAWAIGKLSSASSSPIHLRCKPELIIRESCRTVR